MKNKNLTFKAAGVLLALVLVTSSFVGGTFAKYTTGAEGTDTARVAKFGVTITANGTTFAKEYAKDDISASTITNSVVSADKVLAPGTKGNMSSISITGTPEVAVRVEFEPTIELGENWKDKDGNFYCPLTITAGAVTLKGSDYTSASAFESAIKECIKGFNATYAAGTDLSTKSTPNLSWSWEFKGNDDAKDTHLGDQAAANQAATIEITIQTTVTQID